MKHSIEKMRACLPLLPAPGEEVVAECLDEIESLRQQLSDQREAFAVIAETPVSGEQDDITMEAKDRIAKAIRAWEPK